MRNLNTGGEKLQLDVCDLSVPCKIYQNITLKFDDILSKSKSEEISLILVLYL